MKRNSTALAGALGLILALTGCVQLETDPAPPSAAPGSAVDLPVITSSPAAAVPELDPYSTAGMEQRIKAMSKNSEARRLRAGEHPFDGAVPGSEKILIADTFTGEHHAALPEVTEGNHIMIMVLCQARTSFKVEVYGDPNGTQVASGNSECTPWGGAGIGFGWSPHLTPTYMRIVPDGHEKLEVTVASYEHATLPGS